MKHTTTIHKAFNLVGFFPLYHIIKCMTYTAKIMILTHSEFFRTRTFSTKLAVILHKSMETK